VETRTQSGFSGWILLAIVVAAAVAIYLLMFRRRRAESLSIYDRELTPTVDRTVTTTVTSRRPGPPMAHRT